MAKYILALDLVWLSIVPFFSCCTVYNLHVRQFSLSRRFILSQCDFWWFSSFLHRSAPWSDRFERESAQKKLTGLTSRHSSLTSGHSSLTSRHSSLTSRHSSLTSGHSSLTFLPSPTTTTTIMVFHYEDIFPIIGDLGPFQLLILFVVNLPCISVAIDTYAPLFTLLAPKHRCRLPGNVYHHDSFQAQGINHSR